MATNTDLERTYYQSMLGLTDAQVATMSISQIKAAFIAAGGVTPASNAAYATVVKHAATAGTARPAGATQVLWIGTVNPSNALTDDLFEDKSAAPAVLRRYNGTTFDPVVAASAAAAANLYPKHSGRYYCSGGTNKSAGGLIAGQSASTLGVVPLPVGTSRAFDRISVQVTTAGGAGALVRLGIYTDLNGWPDALLLDAGTIDASTTGQKDLVINQTLSGLVWLGAVQQASTTVQVAIFADNGPLSDRVGQLTPTIGSSALGYQLANVTGALPASFGTPTADTVYGPPIIFLRAT